MPCRLKPHIRLSSAQKAETEALVLRLAGWSIKIRDTRIWALALEMRISDLDRPGKGGGTQRNYDFTCNRAYTQPVVPEWVAKKVIEALPGLRLATPAAIPRAGKKHNYPKNPKRRPRPELRFRERCLLTAWPEHKVFSYVGAARMLHGTRLGRYDGPSYNRLVASVKHDIARLVKRGKLIEVPGEVKLYQKPKQKKGAVR